MACHACAQARAASGYTQVCPVRRFFRIEQRMAQVKFNAIDDAMPILVEHFFECDGTLYVFLAPVSQRLAHVRTVATAVIVFLPKVSTAGEATAWARSIRCLRNLACGLQNFKRGQSAHDARGFEALADRARENSAGGRGFASSPAPGSWRHWRSGLLCAS